MNGPDPAGGPPDAKRQIEECARVLLEVAAEWGYDLRIETEHLQPPAMGNTRGQVLVWQKRKVQK